MKQSIQVAGVELKAKVAAMITDGGANMVLARKHIEHSHSQVSLKRPLPSIVSIFSFAFPGDAIWVSGPHSQFAGGGPSDCERP